jgi:hypothetical protein
MKVSELISKLQKFPGDTEVEVNNNNGGEVYDIDCVELYDAKYGLSPPVVIQVNCE